MGSISFLFVVVDGGSFFFCCCYRGRVLVKFQAISKRVPSLFFFFLRPSKLETRISFARKKCVYTSTLKKTETNVRKKRKKKKVSQATARGKYERIISVSYFATTAVPLCAEI